MLAALRPAVSASLLLLAILSVPACSSASSGGTPITSDYCAQASGYATRCHITDACGLATLQDCSTLASNYSAARIAALAACFNDAACSDAGTALDACLGKPVLTAPTAAQTKLAQDYCAVCPGLNPTEAACVAGFYNGGLNDAGFPTLPGPGSAALGLSDSFATNIDSQCIPKLAADAGAFGCAIPFAQCMVQALGAAFKQPAACTVIPGFDAGSATDGG